MDRVEEGGMMGESDGKRMTEVEGKVMGARKGEVGGLDEVMARQGGEKKSDDKGRGERNAEME